VETDWRQGAVGELTGSTERALGKAVKGEAHPSGGAVSRRGGCFGRWRSTAARQLR
jgi:hypothetical protein